MGKQEIKRSSSWLVTTRQIISALFRLVGDAHPTLHLVNFFRHITVFFAETGDTFTTNLGGPPQAVYNVAFRCGGRRRNILTFDCSMTSILANSRQNLRIGAVSYLNTKPLVYRLAEFLPEAEIVLDYPSRLADSLDAGDLDIALVPSAELLSHPDWSIVSDACIACRGPVLSVKLLFRVRPEQVQTLALDEGSRTSSLLAQILLREVQVVASELKSLPLDSEPQDVQTDAVLVIGDRAIRSAKSDFVEVWDLGDCWCRLTGLPFVFAMWVARSGIDTTAAAEAFTTARDEGYCNLAEIARDQASKMQLSYELVLEYLSQNLHFTMGNREQRGLDLFFRRADECGLVPGKLTVTSGPLSVATDY